MHRASQCKSEACLCLSNHPQANATDCYGEWLREIVVTASGHRNAFWLVGHAPTQQAAQCQGQFERNRGMPVGQLGKSHGRQAPHFACRHGLHGRIARLVGEKTAFTHHAARAQNCQLNLPCAISDMNLHAAGLQEIEGPVGAPLRDQDVTVWNAAAVKVIRQNAPAVVAININNTKVVFIRYQSKLQSNCLTLHDCSNRWPPITQSGSLSDHRPRRIGSRGCPRSGCAASTCYSGMP